ncbi:Hypothetical protein NocV09_00802250 [Nannochloropsis oceanica]
MAYVLNPRFLMGLSLTVICLALALGAVLTGEFANGMAVVSGSEGYASVKLGLWLLELRHARIPMEGQLTRMAAGLSATASFCFVVCLAVWTILVLSLSEKGDDSKAHLAIGMSWLAEGGAFIIAFLLTINMLQTAKRIEQEASASILNAEEKTGWVEAGKASAAGGGDNPRKIEKPRAGRRSHGGGDLEA